MTALKGWMRPWALRGSGKVDKASNSVQEVIGAPKERMGKTPRIPNPARIANVN
jgi:hypothetical protein